jgi:hypothetical protein
VVLKLGLLVNAPLFFGSVVDREGDFYSFIESYIVHLPLIGLGRPNGACREETLIFVLYETSPMIE